MNKFKKYFVFFSMVFAAILYTQPAAAYCTSSSNYRMGTSWYAQLYGSSANSFSCSYAAITGHASQPIVDSGSNNDSKLVYTYAELFAPLYYNPAYPDVVNCISAEYFDIWWFLSSSDTDSWDSGGEVCYIPSQ